MFEKIRMNSQSRKLYDYFNSRFPTAGMGIFRITSEAGMGAKNINEDYKNMSEETALMLKSLYGNLSEDDLREWVFGLLRHENPKIVRQIVEN